MQSRELRADFQNRDLFKSLRIASGLPDLHCLLLGDERPAEPGTVDLVGSHLAAQGRESTGVFVAGARESTTRSGQRGAKPRRCSGLRASQRSRRTREASGLITEPPGRRKPLERPNTFHLPFWLAQRSKLSSSRALQATVSRPVGVITIKLPSEASSSTASRFSAQSKANCSGVSRRTGGNRSAARDITRGRWTDSG